MAITTLPSNSFPSKPLKISLWTVQVILAVMFGMAGAMKLGMPIDALAQQMGWPGAMPETLVRFIGLSEFLAALGLLLPSILKIRPGLTPLAACGLITVMVMASAFHLSRGEFQAVPINLILAGLAAFVAWGRTNRAPIKSRSKESL